MQPENSSSVLEKLLEPVSRTLTPDAAKTLLESRVDDDAQARIAKLAEKCDEGRLSEQERAEYETYVHAGNVLAILKAKARLVLRGQTSG